jgi:hypothetical protein
VFSDGCSDGPALSLACACCAPSCSAACQEKNDGLYMKNAGRQYNEVCETLWAALGALGNTTQVCAALVFRPASLWLCYAATLLTRPTALPYSFALPLLNA